MTFKARIAILFIVLLALLPLSNSSARYNNNFYLQQQSYRNTQMLRQQQMRQQQMLQQQRMRQQQAQMRRQQEQVRRQQQQMRRQMQERRRQAQLQRQRTVKRQRQMQQQRQRKAQQQQRTQVQRQQLAKQQKALQQQRSLRVQRKTKLRQDRLRRLQNDRLKKHKADKKKRDQRTTLTLTALLKRNSAAANLAKPITRTVSKSQARKQFQQRRQQQLRRQRVTKQFEKQRKLLQARAQKLGELKKHLTKGHLQKKKAAEKKKTSQKEAEKTFAVCRGKGCGNKSCSFHGDTRVLTKDGLKPIKSIAAGQDFVWSRSEVTGDFDWKQVIDHYSNDYTETVEVTIGFPGVTKQQTILSNRIHPFFVADSASTEKTQLRDKKLLEVPLRGKWVEAVSLMPGDKLVGGDGGLVEVARVDVQKSTLHAYNITVDTYHTFFVAGGGGHEDVSVWVHNECDTDKGTEKLSKVEAKLLKVSKKGPDGTRVVKDGIGKKAQLYVFNKDNTGKWIRISKTQPALKIASNSAIRFSKGTAYTVFTPNRLQHASRHLIDAGILPSWSKITGQKFTKLGIKILENPAATFDHVLRGGQKVKGFVGKVGGKDVAIMVFKDGKHQGQVATSIVPSAAQMKNWGVMP